MKPDVESVNKMKINDLYNTVQKKCIIIFVIIFMIIMVGGFLSVNYLDGLLTSNNIHTDTIVIKDKFIGNDTRDDCYIVTDINGKTYVIDNNNLAYDKKIFNSLTIGTQYKVTIKTPNPNDSDKNVYIMQVHNDTG